MAKPTLKVGDRVVCARGFAIGAIGHIARRAPATANTDWVVRLDAPLTLGSGTVMKEPWMDDGELDLHHSEVRRG